MISRRALLASTCALPALAKLSVKPGCQTNAWPIEDFDGFLAALGRVRHYGYQGFETGFRNVQGQFGKPKPAREKIQKFGLQFFGVHIFLPEYEVVTGLPDFERIEHVAEGGAALGAKRLILSGRGLLQDGKLDADAVARKAAALERAARVCLRHNLTLTYHNHDVEFKENGAEIEELLRRTDSDLVRLVCDFGHAWRAGANVAEFLARHHRRIEGVHLRDYKSGEQVPLGEGEFDLRPLAAAMDKAGWKGWVMNEEERLIEKPGDKAVEPARAHLKKIFGA